MRLCGFALLFIAAQAAAIDGNELYRLCSRDAATYNDGYCLGYIVGVIDGKGSYTPPMLAGETLPAYTVRAAAQTATSFCIPQGATRRQLYDVVMKHLRDGPQFRHLDATIIIESAAVAAFPCAGGR